MIQYGNQSDVHSNMLQNLFSQYKCNNSEIRMLKCTPVYIYIALTTSTKDCFTTLTGNVYKTLLTTGLEQRLAFTTLKVLDFIAIRKQKDQWEPL